MHSTKDAEMQRSAANPGCGATATPVTRWRRVPDGGGAARHANLDVMTVAASLSALLGLACGCSGGAAVTPSKNGSTTVAANARTPMNADAKAATQGGIHEWKVYDGSDLILQIWDTPGPLRSTAAPPPSYKPPTHPFLSASAYSAGHEDKLRQLLLASSSVEDYLTRLRGAGFTIEPIP